MSIISILGKIGSFILGAFIEKEGGIHISMTRVVAFMFAIRYLEVMNISAEYGAAMSWSFATLGIAVLLAVPLQIAFRRWGKTLSLALINKLGVGDIGQNVSDKAIEVVRKFKHDPGA